MLWNDLLIDGHNRYAICQKHGLPFNTIQATQFKNMDDVHLWMIDQHLGRRSVSDFQRGVLALRKREIIAARRSAAAAAVMAAKAEAPAQPEGEAPWEGETDPVVAAALASVAKVPDEALDTREALARVARLSSSQVKLIETIQQKAAPEVVAAVRSGDISLSTAAVVASLPVDEQQAVAPPAPTNSSRPPSACAMPRKAQGRQARSRRCRRRRCGRDRLARGTAAARERT